MSKVTCISLYSEKGTHKRSRVDALGTPSRCWRSPLTWRKVKTLQAPNGQWYPYQCPFGVPRRRRPAQGTSSGSWLGVSLAMAMTFLTGLAMFGAMTFLPLFQQTVQGESPTVSGLMLTPMMVGSTVTSMLAGQVTTRTGRYKVFPILGGAFMAVAMFLLAGLDTGTTRFTSGLYYVVLGLGMGFLMQMVSLISQNSVAQRDMGVASSARMFFQQIGGSLGVAAFGAIFARRLIESLAAAAGAGPHISASGGQLNPATVDSLPAVIRHDVFGAIAHAVQGVFVWAVPAAVII
ncbi:MAG: MFS transporter, partial [Actinobacteria bacterium]|nr:MFS transporter [Actinomycetota bacterium]